MTRKQFFTGLLGLGFISIMPKIETPPVIKPSIKLSLKSKEIIAYWKKAGPQMMAELKKENENLFQDI